MIEHGFQVLQYDLFGRGYSERPRNPYDIDLFIEQLNELLIALSINLPVTLIGWSLGGMISTIYAARYPNDIERITLIAPTGIDVSLPAISRIGMIPMLGDCIMMLIGRRIILRSLLKGLHRKELIDDYLSLVSEQMEYHGYFQAFLSTLRRCAYKDASSEYESVGNHKLPVMIISGSEDRSIPATVSKRIRELIPNLKCHEIPGTGHLTHFEQPEEVNSLIIDFVLSAS